MSSSPRKRLPSATLTAAVLALIVVAFCALFVASGTWQGLFPPAAATWQGQQIRGLYNIVLGIAAVVFVLVEGLILWSVLRYRRRPGDNALPAQTHGNNLLEVIWTAVPMAIVFFLFIISWQTLNQVDAVSKTPDIHIRAVAGQFQWQFDYLAADGQTKLFTESVPVHDATTNEGGMVVPVGANVELQLTSPDVIHAFYVPRFLFKRDVVPGMVNKFDFSVDPADAGQTFRGQCAELCGVGHRSMLFDVVAMTSADYNTWLQGKIAQTNATPAPRPSGGTVLELGAAGVAYDKKELAVGAGQAFAIHLKNGDPAGLAHNVEIRQADGKTVIQTQKTTDGGTEVTYDFKALPAGTYTYICSIHPIPAMTGTLTVK